MYASVPIRLLFWIVLPVIHSAITFCPQVFGQQPKYHHFGKVDGLPSDNVYDVLIDHENFIWFSTDKGLAKFDGKHFHNYTLENGLPDNEIFSLFPDSKGRIWFGTFNGTPGFYHKGSFYNPKNSPFLKNINNQNFISAICEKPNGNIILGARDGRVHEVDFKGPAKFLFHEIPTSMAAISAKSDVHLEVVTSSCEILTWKHGGKSYTLLHPEQQPLFQEVMVSTKLETGKIVFGYGAKFSVIAEDYKRTNFENKTLRRDAASILKIRECHPYGIFACTSQGAYLFRDLDFSNDKPKRFLPGKHVSNVTSDPEGGLWFTTKEGIYYAPEPSITVGESSQFSKSKNVTALQPLSSSKILLGYEDGVVTILDTKKGEEFKMLGPIKNYYALRANYFLPRSDGKFWVSTDIYLGLGDTSTRSIQPVLYASGSDIVYIRDSLCLCHSFGWMTNTEESLLQLARNQQPMVVGNLKSFDRCFAVHYDNHRVLWVATNDGILRISGQDTAKFVDLEGRLNGSRITDIDSDKDNNVWISTAGASLIWINHHQVRHLNGPKYDFPKHITQVKVVSDYIIAVATDRGIFLLDYNPANPELTWTSTIGAQDGLPSDEINDFSLIDSTLWIATPAGYASFPIEMVKNRALHPSVRIAQFIAAGKDHRESTNTLINYDQQGIRISFSGICFRSLGKFSYKYTLSGLDNEWHFTTNEQVEYPYLEPGNYTFQVFAQNHQGNWSTKPATFSFTILTPYWMSTWFRIVIVATLLLIALFVFWAILSSQRRKLQMRQDLNNAEQRALIGQMNPHFIFNSLNSIQSYYMTHDLAKANDFLSEFGTLIRSTLNNSRKPFVSLSNEVSEISTYLGLESLRLDHRFDFQITVAPELESKSFQIPTMILQPFLENAIWHGVSHLSTRKGLILIRFTLESWCIRCEIEDNGIGREKSMELRQAFSKKRKSHAMNIAAERISLMNGSGTAKISLDVIDLFDADGLSSGTKIVLCFPIISNKGSNHEDN